MQITKAVAHVIRDSTQGRVNETQRAVNDLVFLVADINRKMNVAEEEGFDVTDARMGEYITEINSMIETIKTAATGIPYYGADTLENLVAAAEELQYEWDNPPEEDTEVDPEV